MTLSKNHDLLNKNFTFQQSSGRWFLCKRPVIDILMLLLISGSFTKAVKNVENWKRQKTMLTRQQPNS